MTQLGTSTLVEQSLQLLRRALADPSAEFRGGQWEAIERLVDDRARLLIVQRTGWGKSLVYFLATKLLRDRGFGPTLLISPLLSLMRNQIEAAERLGIRAVTINSSNPRDWERVRAQLRAGQVDILLVSPERLANEGFREETLVPLAERVGLFVVDEAHCISDWGHDFRPDYRRIVRILQLLPGNIPVLATTATANDRVVSDVLATLGFEMEVIRGPLARESLRLQNVDLPSQAERMAWIAEQLPRMPGSGVIYTLTIRDSQRLAAWLRAEGFDAAAYWGGLETEEREALEQRLLRNELKALVATTALGMGFDKPDLGFVIHFQRPGSLIHYYQQVGRAGRAIDQAYGVLLGGKEDNEITDYFMQTAFPPEVQIRQVLQALEQAQDGLSLGMLERHANLSHGQLEKILKLLSVETPSPVSKRGTHWFRNPVSYMPNALKIAQILRLRHEERERVDAYMRSKTCLMRFLAQELDDPHAADCGVCSVCLGRALLPGRPARETTARAAQFLRRNDQTIKPRLRWPGDALATHGWEGPIAGNLRLEVGRALSVWGDDGWGESIRRGKQLDGAFGDILVQASAHLLQTRWHPDPAPRWVTYVPSLKHPRLVADFAHRLARQLGIPFIPCVRKVRDTQPQKVMENSFRQAGNLAKVFQIFSWQGIGQPVLLVDDMVDSGWTFTVVGALLREAGAGCVFPFALAVTSKNVRN